MQLIFYGDFRKLFTPETRCKTRRNSQASPGEIRPQTCTKLAKLAPVIYINLQKYAKVCTRYIYINLPNFLKKETKYLITRYESLTPVVPTDC